MAVELSDEDFAVVHDALRRVNTVFDETEVAGILKAERDAWAVVQQYAPSEVGVALTDATDADLAGRPALGDA